MFSTKSLDRYLLLSGPHLYKYSFEIVHCNSKFLVILYVDNNIFLTKSAILTVTEILQEGIARLWRGTNAGLALAVPTVSAVNVKHYVFTLIDPYSCRCLTIFCLGYRLGYTCLFMMYSVTGWKNNVL